MNFIIGIFGGFLLIFSSVFAQIQQLTDNRYSERFPFAGKDYLMWAGFDGNDSEIYLYNIIRKQFRQLTQNEYMDIQPVLSENYAAWLTLTPDYNEISLCNLQDFNTEKLPIENKYIYSLVITDRAVAWLDSSKKETTIHVYDLLKKKTTAIYQTNHKLQHLVMHSEFLAWERWEGTNVQIQTFHLPTKRVSSPVELPGWNPHLDEKYLTWQGNNFTIYLYDLRRRKLLEVTPNGEDPKVGNNQIIFHGGNFNSYDVFCYNILTHQVTQIANTGPSFYDLHFSPPNIIWRSFDGTDYEIFSLNIEDTIPELPKLTQTHFYSIYPNPVIDELLIRFSEPDQIPEEILLLELDGKKVKSFSKLFAEDKTAIVLKIGEYGPGVFILEIRKGAITERTRVLIK